MTGTNSLLVLSEFDAVTWTRRWRAGEIPSVLPYGMEDLHRTGWELRIPQQHRPHGRLRRKLLDATTHRLGHPWWQAVDHLSSARASAAVMGVLEPHAVMAARLRRLGITGYADRPLMALTCWAGQTLRDGNAAQRERVRDQLGPLDRLFVLSRNQVQIFHDHGFRAGQVIPVPYGIDHRFYTPAPGVERDIDVLAVGQDGGRDYGTLLDAVRGLPLQLVVVAKPENLAGLDIPSNVEFLGRVSHHEYRHLLRRARLAAVPTHDLAYPTGQSVALESAAAGTPLVVTSTAAMREYFTDGREAVMPAPGAVAAWRDGLMDLLHDDGSRTALAVSARERVHAGFTTAHLWSAVDAELSTLVSREAV